MPKNAPKPIPEGLNTVTSHLWFNGNCKEAIEFYKKALGAEARLPAVESPDGKSILHAMLKLGYSNIMMADAWPGQWEQGPKDSATTGMMVYVVDCDALYNRAIDAGCEVVDEMMDAFWGERMGKVKDPFGHCWAIATHKLT
ncbi:MAG: glyoxalase/bleomycin resistance/extradiol dioxygenase family protein [Ignavibacterium sp.]|nr:MAG: glyoxalase/bleomycin resistance/extradiol dioxygenase family protein [Ignavibacterium sp.]